MRALSIAALLGIAGLVPAFASLGFSSLTITAAPLAAGLMAALAVMLSLAAGTGLEFPLLLLAALSLALASVRLRVRWRCLRGTWRIRPSSLIAVPVVGVITSFPLIGLKRAPIDWDALSIWFFHAKWFFAGGTRAAEAMADPLLAFAHPDYPPLASAAVAALWTITGEPELRAAQVVIAVLTYSAVVSLGVGIAAVSKSRWIGPLVGGMVGLAAYGLVGGNGTNGYVDLLWSASACTGALLLLVGSPSEKRIAASAFFLIVAALTKNEGLVSSIAVAAIAFGRLSFQKRTNKGWPLALVPAAAGAWLVLSRVLGARSDLLESGTPSLGRIVSRAVGALGALGLGVLLLMAALAGFTLMGMRAARSGTPVPGSSYLLCVFAWFASLVAAYAISPYDLTYHLATSLPRTRTGPLLLLLTGIAIWLVTAISQPTGGLTGGRHPAPEHHQR